MAILRKSFKTKTLTVVLSKPIGQNNSLMEKLNAHNIATVEFGLVKILQIDNLKTSNATRDAFSNLNQYDLIIFVSPNAIRYSFSHFQPVIPSTLPIAVMGPGSAKTLAEFGITYDSHFIIQPKPTKNKVSKIPLTHTSLDSEALLAEIDQTMSLEKLKKKCVLIVRGETGREWLSNTLTANNITVNFAVVYKRNKLIPKAAQWQEIALRLETQRLAWLITSSETMSYLASLAKKHLTAQQYATLQHTLFIVPYARIAETANQLGFDTMIVSGPGEENSLNVFLKLDSYDKHTQSKRY